MRTFKRKIVDIDTSVDNISKYNNQLTFTGIKQSKNIYEVDQKSQMDTLNVYVNDENTLVSREPLIEDTLPIILNEGDSLVDIKSTNGVEVIVTVNSGIYKITAIKNNVETSLTSTKYQLTIFDQYIICFREEGAKIIDTNAEQTIWEDISNYAEIPITKITSGVKIEELDYNRFTNKHKEQYVITETLRTLLPVGEIPSKVEVYNDNKSVELKYTDAADKFTRERVFGVCDFMLGDKSSSINLLNAEVSGNVVMVALNDNNIYISFDYGQSFARLITPEIFNKYNVHLSDDGKAIFVIGTKCVYRCLLSDFTWTEFYYHDDATTSIGDYEIVKYKFSNPETFMFITINKQHYNDPSSMRLYFKGNGLYDATGFDNCLCFISLSDVMSGKTLRQYGIIREDLYNKQSFVVGGFDDGKICGAFTLLSEKATERYITTLVYFVAGQNSTIKLKYIDYESVSAYGNDSVITLQTISTSKDSTGTLTVSVSGLDCGVSTEYTVVEKMYKGTFVTSTNTWTLTTASSNGAHFSNFAGPCGKLNSEIYYAQGNTFYDSSYNAYKLPTLIKTNTSYYCEQAILTYNMSADVIYYTYAIAGLPVTERVLCCTNLTDNTAVFTYDYTNEQFDTIINKVPDLTYSGEQLYLTFENTLMITDNLKDGENIQFNLPKINNQSFVNNITNLLNISTSEIAIFFENDIIICTKNVSDELGISYSYNKSRLSLGVRLGDDAINTLDGANSVFPTIRGLAIMNYQAYMATTDQVVTFASDNILEIWTDFYNKGKRIKITHMRNYLYITNQTDEYLMLDIRTMSWWKFKVPVNISKFTTDQVKLNVIADKLYLFDKNFDRNKYIDCDDNYIDWYIVSQRLHFGVPNHYKNLKQLIFQLVQSNTFENTIDTEIKLYRKTITYKEPETIRFKIDEFKTVVKRFNYWKINELQWALSSDNNTNMPAQLILNGIDIKYEIGEEVR